MGDFSTMAWIKGLMIIVLIGATGSVLEVLVALFAQVTTRQTARDGFRHPCPA